MSGNFSTPSLADLDGDGDLDAVVGETIGTLSYFENTGSAAAPAFTERTGADNPFDGVDVGLDSAPGFADIDGDGDLDVVVGETDGNLNYFENTGSAVAPAFIERPAPPIRSTASMWGTSACPASPTSTATATSTPWSGKSTAPCAIPRTPARPTRRPSSRAPAPTIRSTASMWGLSATPSFADLDGDGDLDAVVGDLGGTLRYLREHGSANAPAFIARTGAANPFDGADVGKQSRPASPTSTATATSIPSSGKPTAI